MSEGISRADAMFAAAITAQELHDQINANLDRLNDLVSTCHGIFPSAGTDGGIGAALEQTRLGLEQAAPMLIQVSDKLEEIGRTYQS